MTPELTLPCVGCDEPFTPTPHRFFYCSGFCHQMAETVRYERAVRRDGRIRDPEVAEAVFIRRAILNGGGYPEAERSLPKKIREAVLERDGGLCRKCGQQGGQIDHIAGNSADLDNLQLLCDRCHREKTKEGVRPVLPGDPHWGQVTAISAEVDERVFARRPLRPCDDERNWWPMLYREEETKRRRALRQAAKDNAPAQGR